MDRWIRPTEILQQMRVTTFQKGAVVQ